MHATKTRKTWADAEIIAEPVPNKELNEPQVLVKRKPVILDDGSRGDVVFVYGYPAISLFTGAGGFDLGIEQAGFTPLCQVEWDESACKTLMHNRPAFFSHASLIQGDIRKVATEMILKEAGLGVGECYLLVGGPPCQGFSRSNIKSLSGRYDVRNDLVFEYLRIVDQAKPKYFIFENVQGFVSFNEHEYLRAFLERAHGNYYELVYGLVNAAEHGVPQRRIRFICSGTRRDIAKNDCRLASLPPPTHFGRRDLAALLTVSGLPLYSKEERYLRRPPGIRYFPDRELLIPPSPVGEDGRSKKFLDFYQHLEDSEPDRLVQEPELGDGR